MKFTKIILNIVNKLRILEKSYKINKLGQYNLTKVNIVYVL